MLHFSPNWSTIERTSTEVSLQKLLLPHLKLLCIPYSCGFPLFPPISQSFTVFSIHDSHKYSEASPVLEVENHTYVNMGTSKGWTSAETVAACQDYISASEDPRCRSGKKKINFIEKCLKSTAQK